MFLIKVYCSVPYYCFVARKKCITIALLIGGPVDRFCHHRHTYRWLKLLQLTTTPLEPPRGLRYLEAEFLPSQTASNSH